MITGRQLRDTRYAIGMDQRVPARKAGVSLRVIERAEGSPSEPAVTIAQLNALMQTLRTAGAIS